MGNLLYSAINFIFTVLQLAILVRAVISWLPIPNDSMFANLLYQVTEPILAPIRNMIQRSAMGRNLMFDVSPIVALLLLYIVRSIVINLIF